MLAIVAAFFAPKAHAQTALINPNGLALDTGTQAAAEGPKTAIIKGTAKTLNLFLKTTKISGTITGTIQWQASNNGTDFATVKTDTLLNATHNYTYKEVDKAYLYYKPLITQTGTSSLSYSGTWYITIGPINGGR